MENLKLINYLLLGIMFLITCFANLSTRQNKREWFYVGYVIIAIIYFILLHIDSSYQDQPYEYQTIFEYLFASVGLVIPQLVSQIFVRKKIQHPIIFLQNKDKLQTIMGAFFILFLIYFAYLNLTPIRYTTIDHIPVYDEPFVKSRFSLLLVYIPLAILLLEFTTQRTAFCENGLYNSGLISNWENFKSYSWLNPKMDRPDAWLFVDENQNDTLILAPAMGIIKKPIKIFVPISQKMAIDEFLSQRINPDLDR